jgi:sensor histidine kinase YesM
MAEEINKLIVDSYEKEIAKLQTDSLNLRLQVRPHMLLNSLNTIYGLSQSGDNDKIMEFSRSLIDYFRYVLRQETKLVRISDEIELIKNYLKIQKIRFPDCFTTVLDIDDEAADIRIPPLIIENFVENSTKYGLIMGSSIEISISVKKLNEYILVIINDTGSGMDRDTLTKLQNGEIIEDRLGSHIGIWNCRRRLKLYYGDEAKLNIESSLEQGTRVEMKLPLEALDIQDSAGKNFSG